MIFEAKKFLDTRGQREVVFGVGEEDADGTDGGIDGHHILKFLFGLRIRHNISHMFSQWTPVHR